MTKAWNLVLALAAGLAGSVSAQSYPVRPVHIVVPFTAGGGVDVVVRALMPELSSRLGQAVVVENRAGAGSLIGAEAVARAPADGYMLLATNTQTFTSNRYLFKTLPYDPDRSFAPISMVVRADMFLLSHPAVPVRDLKELVALARQRTANLSYGSWGIGSDAQLAYEHLNHREALNLTHVPYKGVGPVMAALAAGEIQVSVASAGVAGGLIKAGKLRPLALAAPSRSAAYPDVPTTGELGYPYLRVAIQIGLWAPAGTPGAVVEKIGDDVRALLKSQGAAYQRLTDLGFVVIGSSAEEFGALLRDETVRTGEIIKAAKIQPN